MTNVISMTSAQADQVRGPSPTDKNQVLTPAQLADDYFVLGPQNIDNPAFVDRKALLQSFPQVDYDTLMAKYV